MTRVLVIDDEAAIRLLCRVNLEADGMKVEEAADGRSGLDLARQSRPDVILLDVMMPGLDGWQVAEELVNDDRTREIPIVFLTARADFRDRGMRGQRLLDGAQEAHLIALRCSQPPAGQAKWTLKLLADQLVALHVVETISYETVRQTIKKTSSSRTYTSVG